MADSSSVAGRTPPPGIHTTIPSSARLWDYLLGGKDNFPIDRKIGEQVLVIDPRLRDAAHAERGFLVRVVRYLVKDAGIRQLLDIGAGLPTVNETHEVAQATAPECHVVYVGSDPMVLVHARALLTSTPEGKTDYLHADLRDYDKILQEASRTLDFTQPVALMLVGIINYITDDEEAYAMVDRLVGALPSGSYLVISHPTPEIYREATEEFMQHWNDSGAAPIRIRSRRELLRFFDGLELIEPGVTSCSLWRPDPIHREAHIAVHQYAGVARIP